MRKNTIVAVCDGISTTSGKRNTPIFTSPISIYAETQWGRESSHFTNEDPMRSCFVSYGIPWIVKCWGFNFYVHVQPVHNNMMDDLGERRMDTHIIQMQRTLVATCVMQAKSHFFVGTGSESSTKLIIEKSYLNRQQNSKAVEIINETQ